MSEGRGVFCYTSTSMTVTGLVASQLGSGIESEYCTIALASSTLSDNRYGYYSVYDTQVSVTTQSAPVTACTGSSVNTILPPEFCAHLRKAGLGASASGVATRKVKSKRAAA